MHSGRLAPAVCIGKWQRRDASLYCGARFIGFGHVRLQERQTAYFGGIKRGNFSFFNSFLIPLFRISAAHYTFWHNFSFLFGTAFSFSLPRKEKTLQIRDLRSLAESLILQGKGVD